MRRGKSTTSNLPPLVSDERIETDSKTGLKIRVTRQSRGMLAVKTRHYDASNLEAWDTTSPREALEKFCEDIRGDLERRGLPSDLTPNWVRVGGGEWERQTNPEMRSSYALPIGFACWSKVLETKTEPLTLERNAGDVLLTITQLLARPGIDKYLWDVGQAMRTYANYRISGCINEYAHQGLVARKSREKGPKAKRDRAIHVRGVVCKHAEHCWSSRPVLRGDASNTALCIKDAVNQELKAEKLIQSGRDGLAAKTIADHIREGIRGQLVPH
jgi:hypothetical protein